MAVSVIQRIRNVYHNLSKGHKRVANLILRNPTSIQGLSCFEIAKKSDVSQSTVVRFINTIGYDSFVTFKSDIDCEVYNDMDEHKRIVALSSNGFTNNLIEQTMLLDIKNIRSTLDGIDREKINQFVSDSISSKRKFIIGLGNDELLAKLLYNNFVAIFDNVCLLLSHDNHFDHLFSLSRGDQVIVFSLTDKSSKLGGISKFAFDKNAIVSLFTDHESSSLSEFARHLIVAKSDSLSFNESFVSASSIISAITLEIIRKDRQRIVNRHKQLNAIKFKYGN